MNEFAALDTAPSSSAAPLRSISDLAPATVNFGGDALFLDFDGTLAEIAPAPDLVHFFPETRRIIDVLAKSFSGAVAIVTGRNISEIDGHMAPLKLPIAGLYGLVHRTAAGDIIDFPVVGRALARASAELKTMAEQHPGLLLELKGQTIALHYRSRPDLGAASYEAVKNAVRGRPGLKMIEGKMVVEITPRGVDKGRAVQDFLREPPFTGRRPIYAGDDVSDEDAFAVVNALGGITIKIGPGATAARYRADHIPELLTWLGAVSHLPSARTS
ncbi:MAG: trehalose-phosphatase [Hyphomicrobiaceae bacterium]